MSGTGSVERILVGGILVVVLAILGIASWSATGSDEDTSPAVATDGGVTGGGASALAKGESRPATEAERLEATRQRNEEALRTRQELAARWVQGDDGEREALAKGHDAIADGPRPVAPPASLDPSDPSQALGAESVPLRSNGKPHTDDPAAVAPLTAAGQPGALPPRHASTMAWLVVQRSNDALVSPRRATSAAG